MAESLPAEVTATLRALLPGTDPVSSALRAQIPHTRINGRCGCGCATVDLTVDTTAVAAAPEHGNPAVDGWYTSPDNAGVMIFTKDGYLSLLEIYSSAAEPVATWPEPRFRSRD